MRTGSGCPAMASFKVVSQMWVSLLPWAVTMNWMGSDRFITSCSAYRDPSGWTLNLGSLLSKVILSFIWQASNFTKQEKETDGCWINRNDVYLGLFHWSIKWQMAFWFRAMWKLGLHFLYLKPSRTNLSVWLDWRNLKMKNELSDELIWWQKSLSINCVCVRERERGTETIKVIERPVWSLGTILVFITFISMQIHYSRKHFNYKPPSSLYLSHTHNKNGLI